MNPGGAADRLDAWLRQEALPLWWRLGADHARGGWYDALTFELEPKEPRRARVQARQAFVYATAGAIGWDGPWREAAWHGMDALLDHYRRTNGLYRAIVSADGLSDRTSMPFPASSNKIVPSAAQLCGL